MATILITGATSGLGRGVADALADQGHTILVHGRDREKVGSVTAALPGESRGYRADLASLSEVRKLAEDVGSNEEAIDVLINNAGVATTERRESEDGVELDFAVNHLAHWLLTGLLLPRLAEDGRVVNVSSIGQAAIDWDDPLLERGWESFRAYAQSKLAQVMFTIDLAARGVTTNALHPATLMDTQMVRDTFGRAMSTVDDGVGPVVRLATGSEPAGKSGRFFNQTSESEADPQAYDDEARRRLWELSAELAGEDPYG